MKKSLLLILLISTLLFVSCSNNSKSLTVYCYDSFVGDWGPGKKLAEDFEKETGIHVDLISCSGSVQLYSKILYEGNKCKADVVIGLPDSISIDTSLFTTWKPNCSSNLIKYNENGLIPFEYGIFAFVFDTENENTTIPNSLKDLSKPEYKNKFILIDPRTSSVGLGLLKWSYYALGSEFESWWKQVLDNALTVSDSWSSAYGLFTEGEAPMVISYTTSPSYHIIYENTERYVSLAFNEGHIKTDEYLGILKSSKKQDNAKKFCEYILTVGQSDIALANTMYPANINTKLPDAYSKLTKTSVLNVNNNDFIDIREDLINQWTAISVR